MNGFSILTLVKDEHRYVFIYTDEQVDEVRRSIGRMASDPALNLSWYDAAGLQKRIQRRVDEAAAEVNP